MKRFTGRAWVFGDSISTDIISPGGGRGDRLRETCMAAVCPEFPAEVKRGDIIVAGPNFGCGSHRESAITILRDLGVEAVVADSIARIYFRVSVSLAYPAFVVPGVSRIVRTGEIVDVDYDGGVFSNLTTGARVPIAPFAKPIHDIYAAGGLIPLLFDRLEKEQTQK